jgi:hypothetical protein
VGGGDEHVGHGVVVTGGAPQPGRVPGVDHLGVHGWEEDLPSQRETLRTDDGFAVAEHDAPADIPGGMARPAGQGPPSADPVAAVDLDGGPIGAERPGGHGVGIAIDVVRPLHGEHPPEGGVAAADHDAPSHRPVGVRRRLDDVEESHRVGLGTTDLRRGHQPEDTQLLERGHDNRRDSPARVHVAALDSDQVGERPHGGDGLGRAISPVRLDQLTRHRCPFPTACSANGSIRPTALATYTPFG